MKRRTPKDYFTYFAPAIVLTLAGFIVAYQFVDPAPPRRITIAAAARKTGYCRCRYLFDSSCDTD
jgi:hypothetical protein